MVEQDYQKLAKVCIATLQKAWTTLHIGDSIKGVAELRLAVPALSTETVKGFFSVVEGLQGQVGL